jgi:hypothetical protein
MAGRRRIVRRTTKNKLLPVVLTCVCCAGALAGEARPDVSWDQIEDWAMGDAVSIALGPKTEPAKPDPKVLASPAKPEPPKPEPAKPEPPQEAKAVIPPPKSTSRRAEPREIAEIKGKFLQRATPRLIKSDADRAYDQSFDIAYKMENYGKAMETLKIIAADKRLQMKENYFRDTDVWVAGKICETGLISGQMQTASLEACIKIWKDKAQKAVEDMKQNGNARNDIPRDAAQIQKREEFYRNFSALQEENKRLELAGEDNPKYLADLAWKLYDQGLPAHPMRYLAQLYKMREWYPDFEYVKSGEVQVRIAKMLGNELWLSAEAAQEGIVAQEKFQQHGAVVSGDICWLIADNWQKMANEQKTNRDAMEYFTKAKTYYELFQKKYGSNSGNRGNGPENKSDCQRRLEEVNKAIAARIVRNQ